MQIIKPGLFSRQVAADLRRSEFDSKNEQLLQVKKEILMVFIGDSLTHAFELNAYFGGKEGLFVNRGIGGDIPFYINKRFAADVLQLHPLYAVLLCGINETWGMEGKEGKELQREKEEAINRILEPIRNICTTCRKNEQGLVLCSMLPTYGTGAAARERKELVWEVNKALRGISVKEGFLYADYHSALVQEDGRTMREAWSYDGCHVNAQGYGIMAEVLRKTMKTVNLEI